MYLSDTTVQYFGYLRYCSHFITAIRKVLRYSYLH